MHIIQEIHSYGLELKLSTQQLDQNAIFCLGIPAHSCKLKKDKLIHAININQPELKAMDIYVLSVKAKEQKIK